MRSIRIRVRIRVSVGGLSCEQIFICEPCPMHLSNKADQYHHPLDELGKVCLTYPLELGPGLRQ